MTRRRGRKWKGGVYLIRTRHPDRPAWLLLFARHHGYVGESNDYRRRKREHLIGHVGRDRHGRGYVATAKSWADLDPVFIRLIPLPDWKWLRLAVEALCIWVLCPVYNVQRQPPWNLRKRTISNAERARAIRDTTNPFVKWAHRVLVWISRTFILAALVAVAYLIWSR